MCVCDFVCVCVCVCVVCVCLSESLNRTFLPALLQADRWSSDSMRMGQFVTNALAGLSEIQINNLQQSQLIRLDHLIRAELKAEDSCVSRTYSRAAEHTAHTQAHTDTHTDTLTYSY